MPSPCGRAIEQIAQAHADERLANLVLGRIGPADAQVLEERRVEQVGALLDDPEVARHVVAELGARDAAERRHALLRHQVAADESRERRFARAAAPENGDFLAERDGQVEPAQRVGGSSVVAEARPLHADIERSDRLPARGGRTAIGIGQVVEALDRIAVGARLLRRRRQGREHLDEREEAQGEGRDPVGAAVGKAAEAGSRPSQQHDDDRAEHELQRQIAHAVEPLDAMLLGAQQALGLLMRREVVLAAPGDTQSATPSARSFRQQAGS